MLPARARLLARTITTSPHDALARCGAPLLTGRELVPRPRRSLASGAGPTAGPTAATAASSAEEDPFAALRDGSAERLAWSARDAVERSARLAGELSDEDVRKMARLAHLDVSHRDAAFKASLSRVVAFCRALDEAPAAQPAATATNASAAAEGAADAPIEPVAPRPDVVVEGGDARRVLANAKRTVDDFFVAPRRA